MQTQPPERTSPNRSLRSRLLPRLAPIAVLVVAVPVLLTAWSLAAPIGSSPDDSYHLPSIWCAGGHNEERCAINASDQTATVPGLVAASSWCYAPLSDVSAACQDEYTDKRIAVETWNGGNGFYLYPPVYYKTMSLLIVDNPRTSVLLMRGFNVALVTLFLVALVLLARRSIRQAVLVSLTAVSVPLGLFLVSSNNPSGWAVIGVGVFWAFGLIALESPSRRIAAISYAFAVLAALVAAGARGDAAIYIAFSCVLIVILTLRRGRSIPRTLFRLRVAPLAAIIGGCFAAFTLAKQSGVAVGGFTGGTDYASTGAASTANRIGEITTAIDTNLLFIYLKYVPEFIAGGFGGWGLGWLDTPMPAVVVWISFPITFALVIIGMGRMYRGKSIALALGVAAVIGIPTWIAVTGNHLPGTYLQPRYIYPLFVVVVGMALVVSARGGAIRLARAQWLTLAVALSVAQSLALHAMIRRFVTGNDVVSFNLNASVEWWRAAAPSPMTTWLLGSIAFTVIAVAAFSTFRAQPCDSPPRHEETVSSGTT